MTDKQTKARRILDLKKQPTAHEQLDIDPNQAGKSLLHDQFGIPRVAPAPKNKGDIPVMQELSNTPVTIKASEPDMSKVKIARGIPKGRISTNDDDGFIPPKSNFVAVGQTEHEWYSEKVTGQPQMVDNNKDIDVDNLQGFDNLQQEVPSIPAQSQVRIAFENRIKNLSESILGQIKIIPTQEQLELFKVNILGQTGVMVSVLKQFHQIPIEERAGLGDVVNNFINEMQQEFQIKEREFSLGNSSVTAEQSNTQENVKVEQETLEEGDFGIFIDDHLYDIQKDVSEVKNALSDLVLGKDIDVKRIQVLKRIPIDFGIILDA